MEKVRIVVYGGSFDPVHKGHISLLSAAAGQINPDLIMVFPAYNSPFKYTMCTSDVHRTHMLKEALLPLASKTDIVIDDYELKQKRKVYSIETLKYVKSIYPNSDIYLLMGSDCALEIDLWRDIKTIRKMVTLVTGFRKGYRVNKKIKNEFLVLKGNFPLLASSTVKSKIYTTGSVPSSVDLGVASYIKQHSLYGLNIRRKLAGMLSGDRLEHTYNVVARACDLAAKYKANLDVCALSAYLHDCAKGLTNRQLIDYVKEHKLKVKMFKEISKHAPTLLHGVVGAHMAQKVFHIADTAVINAVRKHSVGSANMSKEEKILYIADAISKDRKYPKLKQITAAAYEDLELGFRMVVKNKLIHIISSDKWFYPGGAQLWNHTVAGDRQ